MNLQYGNNAIFDGESKKKYNLSDATDMKILCSEVNAELETKEIQKNLLQFKLNEIRRITDG